MTTTGAAWWTEVYYSACICPSCYKRLPRPLSWYYAESGQREWEELCAACHTLIFPSAGTQTGIKLDWEWKTDFPFLTGSWQCPQVFDPRLFR